MRTQEIEAPALPENDTVTVNTFLLCKRFIPQLCREARVAIVFFAILCVCVTAASIYASRAFDLERRWAAENVDVVNQWLEALRTGESGKQFWSKESYVNTVRFYAVTSWDIVRSESGGVWVRVDSSNTSGMPIRKIWKVEMRGFNESPSEHGTPKICRVADPDKE